MNWLQKICKVLRHSKSTQIIGELVRFDSEHKIVGKCALGELGSRAGMTANKLLEIDDGGGDYYEILEKYKVPKWLTEGYLPALEKWSLFEDHSNKVANLDEWIINLNDDFEFTEPEIADFLETTFKDAV